MRKHNLSQINSMLAEVQRLERENVALPETEQFTPAYALEDAEGLRAVLFSCYYGICELLFNIACSIVRRSVAAPDFTPAHNAIIAILSTSNQVTKHATSSSQSIYLIATMKSSLISNIALKALLGLSFRQDIMQGGFLWHTSFWSPTPCSISALATAFPE